MFAKHHYLSHSHNNAANVFIATVNDEIAGFISILPQPCKTKYLKRVHRLVILPDYQGVGIGIKLLNEVGLIYKKDKWRYIINTTSPSLIYALKKSNDWNCHHYGRTSSDKMLNSNRGNKITASFELK